MSSVEIWLLVVAYVPVLVMLVSGALHLANRTQLMSDLNDQAIWPERSILLVSVGLIVTEFAVGAVALVALLRPGVLNAAPPFALLAAVYLLFAVFTVILIRLRPGAPCGCSDSELPAGSTIVVRAMVLSLCAGLVAPNSHLLPSPAFAIEYVVGMVIAVTFTALAWAAPDALHRQEGPVPQIELADQLS